MAQPTQSSQLKLFIQGLKLQHDKKVSKGTEIVHVLNPLAQSTEAHLPYTLSCVSGSQKRYIVLEILPLAESISYPSETQIMSI